MRRPPGPHQLRLYAMAASATLASGAIMALGGYLFHTDGWSVAGLVMLPAGFLISAAFVLARRAGGSGRSERVRLGSKAGVLAVVGVPNAGADLPLIVSAVVAVAALAAGALMVLAGYAAAAWNPLFVPLLIIAAGGVILVGFVAVYVGDRLRAARPESPRREDLSTSQG